MWRARISIEKCALDLSSLRAVQSGAQEDLNSLGHGCKTLVFGQALAVAKINLLHDDRKLETRESEIESDLGSIAPRFSHVVLYEFFPCKTAGKNSYSTTCEKRGAMLP